MIFLVVVGEGSLKLGIEFSTAVYFLDGVHSNILRISEFNLWIKLRGYGNARKSGKDCIYRRQRII